MSEQLKRKPVPRLFSHLNIILALHLVLVAAFVTDLVPAGYVSEELEAFFSFDQGIVIASLLVVWTFMTALILYYIGKKDERFYGIRNWKIAIQTLGPWQKRGIVAVLGLVLLLLLLAGIVKLPVTLTALSVLLFVTAGYMLWTVIKMSDEDVLKQELTIWIGSVYEPSAWKRACLGLLKDMDCSDQNSLEFLSEIIIDSFIDMTNRRQQLEFYKLSSVIIWTTERIDYSGFRLLFLKNLADRMVKRCPEAVDFFTAVMITAMESKGDPAAEFRDVLSVIPGADIRNTLVIRALVYNTYIEARMGKACRMPVQKRLRHLLATPIGAAEKTDAVKFWWILYRMNEEIRGSMSLKEAMRWLR